jgi:hypothetical protein
MTLSRRAFLQVTTAMIAMPVIIPSRVLGQVAHSKKITLGLLLRVQSKENKS